METIDFDAALGGNEHLPNSINSLKFAASRSVEIAAMTESILRPSKTKLIFQSLPVHMRRRVMSHNSKRLPKKLREGHMEQLKKSGLPPKQKRPSRKYRRRPSNLLEEYNRRQKRNVWLETHIWHAKRFHMIDRWGHRIAYAPCDKAFRACYRASSVHCLIQDISYYAPIEITGPPNIIRDMFSSITNSLCGLSIGATAFINGKREGAIHLYKQNMYPFGYLGKVKFIWLPKDDSNKSLWLFVHPSQKKEIETLLSDLLCNSERNDENESARKRVKLTNIYSENINVEVHSGIFNIFRLTGPNSHAVLTHSLKCVSNMNKLATSKWVTETGYSNFYLNEKLQYWQSISTANSASQLPTGIIVGLIVRDPRLSRPQYRTKAILSTDKPPNVESLITIPPNVSVSPLWKANIHDVIKSEKMNNTKFIDHISKTQLVPGEIFEDDPALQCVPVVLIQRPGSQDSDIKKIGYGSGWDIVIPSGYGMQFWQTFIMFGARSGGLRESESLAFEMGECYLPPDCNAGKDEEIRIKNELKEKYFKLPPSKRVNYIKYGINSPFICPWKLLLKDWSDRNIEDYFVLRDKHILTSIQDCITNKRELPHIENASSCLVALYFHIIGKGFLKKHALICLPNSEDLRILNMLVEPLHKDPNVKIRKEKRREHIIYLKKLRRKRIKLRKKSLNPNIKKKKHNIEPSDFVKTMRELWLPTDIETVRHSCSREVMGYLPQAAFSFTEAKSCGIGYVAYNALNALLRSSQNQVLVRNTSSRKYRLASIRVIKTV